MEPPPPILHAINMVQALYPEPIIEARVLDPTTVFIALEGHHSLRVNLDTGEIVDPRKGEAYRRLRAALEESGGA